MSGPTIVSCSVRVAEPSAAVFAASRAMNSSAIGALDEDPPRRHADLALVQVGAEGGGVDGVVEVGVVEHDQRVLAAELEHDALQVAAGGLGELRPVAVEPVKLIRRTAGFSTSSSPIGRGLAAARA